MEEIDILSSGMVEVNMSLEQPGKKIGKSQSKVFRESSRIATPNAKADELLREQEI